MIAQAVAAARDSDNRGDPAVFAPPICTFTNPDRARGIDLANGLSLSVEIDEGDTGKARRTLEALLGPVTVAVASGGEWTDPQTGELFPKLHLHWRLSEPTRDAEDHARLRRARDMAGQLVGADPTGKPVVHPLRWPGSWNRKATPCLATIAAINDGAEIHLPDALERLEDAIEGAGLASVGLPRSGTPQAPIALVRSAMQAIPNAGDDRHYDEWIRFGYASFRATGGCAEGFAIWDEWSSESAKYDGPQTEAAWKRIAGAINGSKPPPVTAGAGSIFWHAAAHGWKRPAAAGPSDTAAGVPVVLFDPWNALQPPPFSPDALPAVLRAFVENRSRVIGADPCAVAWAAISACSTALDARIRLQMKQHDGWTVPPFVWLALVGAPSTKKTPILDAAWQPLQRAQAADMTVWREEQAQWQALPKKERAETAEPVCPRRLVSHDATIESLQEILGRQSRGLGLLRDELAGWVGSLEKYTSGRGSAADRAFYLSAFNGGPYVVDRVGRGTVSIDNLSLAIAGGVQPDRLRQLGDITADGLWQRFLPIIVGPASLGCDDADYLPVQHYGEAVERLLQVDPKTVVQLCGGAHAIREDVARRLFDLEQSEALGGAFSAFCGKLIGLWGRLCLVLSQVDPAPVPFIVPERITEAATTLIFASVLPNAARVYSGMGGGGSNIDATQSIAGFILTKRKDRVLASDLANNVWACRGQPLEDVQRLAACRT